MKRKLLSGIAAFLLFIAGGVYIMAAALEEGAYIVSNTTYYVNPDTGAADDGGDTSTGEGMCRNATYPESLYELESGKHYVTMRIKLISFISDIHFFVQQTKGDADTYKEVSYTTTGENPEKNTRDFRFELPAPDVLIKPQFFVGPMNRDVTYFVGLDMDTAKADEGAFTTFNSTAEETPAPETPTTPVATIPSTPAPSSADTQGNAVPAPTPTAQPEKSPPETPDGSGEPAGMDKVMDSSSNTNTSSPSPAGSETDEEGAGIEEGGSEEVLGIAGFTSEGDAMTVDNKDKDKEKTGGAREWAIALGLVVAAAALVIIVGRLKWKKR